ncbi:cytochrome P450 [Streptomyces sp. NPDC055299]
MPRTCPADLSRTAIPCVPGALPVVGHALALARRPLEFLSSLPAHGDLVEVKAGPLRVIVICDPALTRQVLLDDRTFDKGGPLFDRVREIIGDGIASCGRGSHRRLRRVVQPALHNSRMEGYAVQMSSQFDTLTADWQDGQTLDVVAEMVTGTSRTIAATVFAGSLPEDQLTAMCGDVKTVLDAVPRRAVLPAALTRLPTPGNRRFDQANARLRTQIAAVVAAGHTDQEGLLAMLIQAPPGESCPLSDTEIADNTMTFFLAGIDTTAHALAWALHLIAAHPKVERQLHAEVDALLQGGTATYNQLPDLPITAKVLNESLRLYPPGWLFTRITTAPTTLGGYRIPTGRVIAYSPYLLHHRPDLHPDPDLFDPHRDLAAQGAYIPFGAGARQCAGRDFAFTEAVLALATIASRWKLTPAPGSRVRPSAGLALGPGGLRMRIARRK